MDLRKVTSPLAAPEERAPSVDRRSVERKVVEREPSADRRSVEPKERPPSADRELRSADRRSERRERPPSVDRELRSADRRSVEPKERAPSADRELRSADRRERPPSADRELRSADRRERAPSADRDREAEDAALARAKASFADAKAHLLTSIGSTAPEGPRRARPRAPTADDALSEEAGVEERGRIRAATEEAREQLLRSAGGPAHRESSPSASLSFASDTKVSGARTAAEGGPLG